MEPLDPSGRPWIAAHRGASADAPENTLASLTLAVEQGADMIETDLQLSADGHLVACHDRDLRRVAGLAVRAEEQPAARLPLPTLGQILAAIPPGVALNLELKRYRARRRAVAAALARRLAGLSRRLLVSSIDARLLLRVAEVLPGVPLAPISGRASRSLLDAGARLGAWSLHCHRRLASRALAARARASGRYLLVYTVNDARLARRLLALGVSGLFTDAPARLRRELGLPARGPRRP